jgi:hypothetical protein
MAATQSPVSVPQWLGQQLLGPVDDAAALARRYRDLDAFRDYVGARTRLVLPAALLLVVTGIACGLTPIMLLVGTNAGAALAGLLLAPVVLVGSLFTLGLTFFSWLEERSLARTLGHRAGAAPNPVARWIRRKLRADLGRVPRVPWLLALLFVLLPMALLARQAPALAGALVFLLAVMPILFARLDR